MNSKLIPKLILGFILVVLVIILIGLVLKPHHPKPYFRARDHCQPGSEKCAAIEKVTLINPLLPPLLFPNNKVLTSTAPR